MVKFLMPQLICVKARHVWGMGWHISLENSKQLWIPPGFAHGFYVVSQTADLAYKCTDYYKKGDEFSVE